MDDLRLQMQATTVVINGETVISTGILGFGILGSESSDHTILDLTSGSWLPFNFSSEFLFWKSCAGETEGTTLAAAEFNASATIVVITNETDLAYFAVGLLLDGTLKRLFSLRLFSAAA